MSKTLLFSEFEEISAKVWKQKIQFDLKGADYGESLIWESPEGIKVKPFYNEDDLLNTISPIRKKNTSWTIGQEFYVTEEQKTNVKALDAIDRGATSVTFIIAAATIDPERLLNGILQKDITVHFQLLFLSIAYVENLVLIFSKYKANCTLQIDPIGKLAKTGNWYYNQKKDFEIIEQILVKTAKNDTVQILAIDATLYQNAGATIVQQLAYAMAHANEYLNAQEEGPAKKLQFTFKIGIGSNYFFEIAKLRALRILWSKLIDVYNLDADCFITAVPSRRNKTLYDYNVNMLRTTTECMSAILGGANTICNTPYDHTYHKDNEFGERIARNQLLILQHESFLNQVSNPADGSYYIESITQQLAQKALDLFKIIEAGDGFLAQLKAHHIQKKIKESAQKEQDAYDAQNEILVGSNSYQDTTEQMSGSIELYPFLKKQPKKTIIEPIIERRLSEAWEQERLKKEPQPYNPTNAKK